MKYIFLIALYLSSSLARAAYCVKEDVSGNLQIDSVSIEACPSEIILLSKTEYDAISIDGLVTLLTELFEFSTQDFAEITGMLIVSFITGHVLGRIARLFGKT
jgi:hypothetical protein